MSIFKLRLELRCVTYRDGDILVKQGWTVAKEEDQNHVIGVVYLERTEDAPILKAWRRIFHRTTGQVSPL